jgi:hypothetical protein
MTVGTVERAFQLAPQCKTLEELRSKLAGERHTSVDAHLKDALRRELKKLLRSVSQEGTPAP